MRKLHKRTYPGNGIFCTQRQAFLFRRSEIKRRFEMGYSTESGWQNLTGFS